MHNIIIENFIYNVFKRILTENENDSQKEKEEKKKKLFSDINLLFANLSLLSESPSEYESIYTKQYNIIYQFLMNTQTTYTQFLGEKYFNFNTINIIDTNNTTITEILKIQANNRSDDVDFNKFKKEIEKYISDCEDDNSLAVLKAIKDAPKENIFSQDLIEKIGALNSDDNAKPFQIKINYLYKRLIFFIINNAVNISLKYKGFKALAGKKKTLENFFGNPENQIKIIDKEVNLSTIHANIKTFCENLFQTRKKIQTKNKKETSETEKVGGILYLGFIKILMNNEIIGEEQQQNNLNFQIEESDSDDIRKEKTNNKISLYGYAVICFFDNIFNIINKEVRVHESFEDNQNFDIDIGYKKINEIGSLLYNKENQITGMGEQEIENIDDFIKQLNTGSFDLVKNQQFTATGKVIYNKLFAKESDNKTIERPVERKREDHQNLLYLTPAKILYEDLKFIPFSAARAKNPMKYQYIAQNLIRGEAVNNIADITFDINNEDENKKNKVWEFVKSIFTETPTSLELLSLFGKANNQQFYQLRRYFFKYLSDEKLLGEVIESYMRSNTKQKVFILDLSTVKYIYLNILQKTLRLKTVQDEIFLEAQKVNENIDQEKYISQYLNGISVNGNAYKSFDDIFKVQ